MARLLASSEAFSNPHSLPILYPLGILSSPQFPYSHLPLLPSALPYLRPSSQKLIALMIIVEDRIWSGYHTVCSISNRLSPFYLFLYETKHPLQFTHIDGNCGTAEMREDNAETDAGWRLALLGD